MVMHSIKVYARLKQENEKYNLGSYDIIKKKNGLEDIVFSKGSSNTSVGSYGFRFHKIFDQKSSQAEIFETVAVPVINSVLEGFNGTIFAYGQTGSGKTFTITGSPKNYNDRGIIPRCIQYVFRRNEKISEKPTIYLSYMEIYNEVGYDLLSPKQMNTARYLEELPRITLLEDKKGEAHIRNLSVSPVTTEQEAMRLLFLGDTNRTIAETPMNEYSSRSHCIFTIYLTHRDAGSKKLRFSKLHLVDLAGSERVSKSLSTGQALSEAKHINLSLHFLQQVILALSECNRNHIPYRNSMMTFILRDSLSGNCLTSMLATLAVSKNNILETISTCRFAQRVSMVSTEPVMNEIIDPQLEISFLKNRIEELEYQLASSTSFKNSSTLTDSQKSRCQYEVKQYLENAPNNQDLKLHEPDLRQVQFCFGLLKKEFTSQKEKCQELKIALEDSKTEIDHQKRNILERDEQIEQLKKSLDRIPCHQVEINNHSEHYFPAQTMLNSREPLSISTYDEENEDVFSRFLSYPEHSKSLSFLERELERKLEAAKVYAQAIKQCQKNITYIKRQLETRSCHPEKALLIQELHKQQEIYKRALAELKELEDETRHLEHGLKQEEYKVKHDFEGWQKQANPKYSDRNDLQSLETATTCSSKLRIPICQAQCFEHPVCPRRACSVYPPEYRNENVERIFTCRHQYPEDGSRVFFHNNPHHSETNICCVSRCCQMLQPNNIEYVSNHCECSDNRDNNSEKACFDYFGQASTDMLTGTEDVRYEIQPEGELNIGDDAGIIFRTSSNVDKSIEVENTGRNVDIGILCGVNENDSSHEKFYRKTDSKEFKEFMDTVTLTGEAEIDEDIFNFYRSKF